MAKQLVIQDVCDVTLTDISSDKVMANTYMQISGLSGTVNEEDLRAGIGNSKIFKIRSEKDIELNFTSAVFDADWLAMTQGVELKNDKEVEVTYAARLSVDRNGKVDIDHKEAEITDLLITLDGETIEAENYTLSDGEITFNEGAQLENGDEVTVSYKTTVVGDAIEFDAAKFSRKVRIDMRTIAYDLETGEVYSDIYFVFPEAMAGGDFDLSFEAGNVITPEFTFSVLQPKGTTVLGEMVEVPRTAVEEDTTP